MGAFFPLSRPVPCPHKTIVWPPVLPDLIIGNAELIHPLHQASTWPFRAERPRRRISKPLIPYACYKNTKVSARPK